jgi:hypothetical protein
MRALKDFTASCAEIALLRTSSGVCSFDTGATSEAGVEFPFGEDEQPIAPAIIEQIKATKSEFDLTSF